MKEEILIELIKDRIGKITDKGTDVTDVDIYNLCFLNKLRDKDEQENN